MPEPNHKSGQIMYSKRSQKSLFSVFSMFSLAAGLCASLLVMVAGFMSTTIAQAQQANNASVCVLAYNDANGNATRDGGETLLTDVAVNLIVNENVIIANHVTDGKEPFCFTDLAAQQYTVAFKSPLYVATTLEQFTFPLANGERVTKEFGAASTAATESAPVSSGITVSITPPVRIGLSAAGAIAAMLFIGAIGLILYGLFGHRRSS
jgi:hypothetical protein